MPDHDRKPFAPITVDPDDDAIDALARDKGIRTLERPEGSPVDVPPPAADQTHAAPAETPPAAKKAEPDKPAGRRPTPRSQLKKITIEIPDYVDRALKIRAIDQGVSVRHIIMKCLSANKIKIHDADMIEDGRRAPRGRKGS